MAVSLQLTPQLKVEGAESCLDVQNWEPGPWILHMQKGSGRRPGESVGTGGQMLAQRRCESRAAWVSWGWGLVFGVVVGVRCFDLFLSQVLRW